MKNLLEIRKELVLLDLESQYLERQELAVLNRLIERAESLQTDVQELASSGQEVSDLQSVAAKVQDILVLVQRQLVMYQIELSKLVAKQIAIASEQVAVDLEIEASEDDVKEMLTFAQRHPVLWNIGKAFLAALAVAAVVLLVATGVGAIVGAVAAASAGAASAVVGKVAVAGAVAAATSTPALVTAGVAGTATFGYSMFKNSEADNKSGSEDDCGFSNDVPTACTAG